MMNSGSSGDGGAAAAAGGAADGQGVTSRAGGGSRSRQRSAPPKRSASQVPAGDGSSDGRSRSPLAANRKEPYTKVPIGKVERPSRIPSRVRESQEHKDEHDKLRVRVAAMDEDLNKVMKFLFEVSGNAENHADILDQLKGRERMQRETHLKHSENMFNLRAEMAQDKKHLSTNDATLKETIEKNDELVKGVIQEIALKAQAEMLEAMSKLYIVYGQESEFVRGKLSEAGERVGKIELTLRTHEAATAEIKHEFGAFCCAAAAPAAQTGAAASTSGAGASATAPGAGAAEAHLL